MLDPFAPTTAPARLPISGPLTLGELLDRAFRLYRCRFRTFVLTAGIFLLPWSLLSGLFTGSYAVSTLRALRALTYDSEDFYVPVGLAGQSSLISVLVSLVGALLILFVTLALTSQALVTLKGGAQGIGESLRAARRSFTSALGMQILRWLALAALLFGLALVTFLGTVVFGLTIGGIANLFDPGSGAVEDVLILAFFALILCMSLFAVALLALPVAYLFARWIIALPGIVDLQWRAGESLRQSWRLTRGAALRCTGYLLLLWVLSFVIVSLPTSLVQSSMAILLPSETLPLTLGAVSVLSALLSMLWQPLFAIALVLLYFDLRVRREGYDILLRVEAMEAGMRAATSGSQVGEVNEPLA